MNKKLLKIIIPAAAVILAAAIAVFVFFTRDSGSTTVPLAEAGLGADSGITLISHRGMTTAAPENTTEAAVQSAAAGYKHVEFDVRRTLDGVWVLMHDSDVKRTTNGTGEISELTLRQLFDLKIDSGNGLESCGDITVPTIEEMLSVCANNGLMPVIEIKQSGTEHISELLNIIADCYSLRCMIITFDREQAEFISAVLAAGTTALLRDNITLMWLTSDLSEETLETAKSNTGIGVSFNANKAGTAEEIEAFRNEDIALAAWTVNNPERLKELYDLGITCFTTDNIVYNETTDGED